MGPLEVTAGIAAALLAVVVGVWVAVRRRERRRRDEAERRDDAMVRAQVLERLARVTAEWEGRADQDVTDATVMASDASGIDAPLSGADGSDDGRAPVGGRPAAVTGRGHAVDEHPRHRRPGHGIRVRRHRRA